MNVLRKKREKKNVKREDYITMRIQTIKKKLFYSRLTWCLFVFFFFFGFYVAVVVMDRLSSNVF